MESVFNECLPISEKTYSIYTLYPGQAKVASVFPVLQSKIH
jgi:hypothetical protein